MRQYAVGRGSPRPTEGHPAPVWLVNDDQDRVMTRQEVRFLAAGPHVRGWRFDCGHGVSLVRSREFGGLVNRVALGPGLDG